LSHCILDIEDLSIEGSEFNIENINLTINKGQILGLLGPNGSGKNKIAKSILGLIKYNSGKIFIDGIDPEKNNEQIKKYIGYVSENSSIYKEIKCIDFYKNIKKSYKNWDDILFSSLIDEFDFDLSKKIENLSRVNLIKFQLILSISHHPKLIILDKMPPDINPLVKNHILQRIKLVVKEEECCALLLSDKTDDVYKIADKISYIHNGKIVMTEDKHNI
jgi:ABC-2 type transport system ATP-binding protein